jgi:MFS family permease
MALRWFLGMAESAFFPLVIYYQTTFYRRGELARRLAIFYAASNIANAFGGLLSWAVFRIDSGPLASWRYLFIIEGSLTISFAVFAYWYLPYNSQTARFLTPEEKDLAFYRMQMDSSSIVDQKFNFKDAAVIFKHPTTWIILAIEMCLGVPLQVSPLLYMDRDLSILVQGPLDTLFANDSYRVSRYGCHQLSLAWATGPSKRTCIQWRPT